MFRLSVTISAIWFLALAAGAAWYTAGRPAGSQFGGSNAGFIASLTRLPVGRSVS